MGLINCICNRLQLQLLWNFMITDYMMEHMNPHFRIPGSPPRNAGSSTIGVLTFHFTKEFERKDQSDEIFRKPIEYHK